jgi:hypothetical protein
MLTNKELESIKEYSDKATPGPWTASGNIPFYVDLVKPAQSLSKHDLDRPTYWRYEDGEFVLNARMDIPRLLEHIVEMESDQRAIASEGLQRFLFAGPEYMKIEDENYVLASKLKIALEALKTISGNTYGTEICNSDEENNEILAQHFFVHQGIARKAVKEIED